MEQKSAGKAVAPKVRPLLMGQNYNFPGEGTWGVEGYLKEDEVEKAEEANDT